MWRQHEGNSDIRGVTALVVNGVSAAGDGGGSNSMAENENGGGVSLLA